jgi:hypothetical protein
VSFSLSSDGDHVILEAPADALAAEGAPDTDRSASRLSLIRALFPDADVGRSVRVRVPTAGPAPA